MRFLKTSAIYLQVANKHSIIFDIKPIARFPQSIAALFAAGLFSAICLPNFATAKDFAAAEKEAQALLDQMTLLGKIGQMMQVDSDALKKIRATWKNIFSARC
jgi:hypothetical protein